MPSMRLTASPMNNGTRVLSTKAIDEHAEIRERARHEMFDLLTAEPEPAATKNVRPPVEIASFEC